jgi:hypothetical protein
MPSRCGSSNHIEYVPALCTHRPSLLPIGLDGEGFGLSEICFLVLSGAEGHSDEKFPKSFILEEGEVVTRFP